MSAPERSLLGDGQTEAEAQGQATSANDTRSPSAAGTGTPHSHDAIFKKTFGVPEHALDLIRRQLPAELVAALDPGSLREVSGTYVDETLRETRSDVLFSARLEGKQILLYVLIEHQSTQDPLMPLRLLGYVVRIWERWVALVTAEAKGVPPTTLPPVIPFVLHQGPKSWALARSLSELVPLPGDLESVVRPFLPALDLSILDLGDGGPAALKAWRAAPIVKITLAVMRGVVDPTVDLTELLGAFGAELTEVMRRPGGRRAFSVVVGYIVRRRGGLDVAALAARAAELAGREAREVVMSTAQELIDQGEAKGVRETLVRQLRAKFGRVTPEVTQRLDEAGLADLTRWTERILSAERVEDVFTPAKGSRRRGRRPRRS